jgi:hypothetical protein
MKNPDAPTVKREVEEEWVVRDNGRASRPAKREELGPARFGQVRERRMMIPHPPHESMPISRPLWSPPYG